MKGFNILSDKTENDEKGWFLSRETIIQVFGEKFEVSSFYKREECRGSIFIWHFDESGEVLPVRYGEAIAPVTVCSMHETWLRTMEAITTTLLWPLIRVGVFFALVAMALVIGLVAVDFGQIGQWLIGVGILLSSYLSARCLIYALVKSKTMSPSWIGRVERVVANRN